MSLDKALKNLKFDIRMTESNVALGVITQDELNAHLANLPDSGANAEKLNLEEGSSSDSDLDTQH